MRIILASESIYRKREMGLLGIPYEVIPAYLDEKAIRHDNPAVLTKKLSEAKARFVGDKNLDAIIVGGDQVIVSNNQIYEKPADLCEAYKMLKELSGNKVTVVNGLAVYNPKEQKMLSTVKKYTMTFRQLIDSEIKRYIKTAPVLTCAGSFDDDGAILFCDTITGKYPTTLPMKELIDFLRKNKVNI